MIDAAEAVRLARIASNSTGSNATPDLFGVSQIARFANLVAAAVKEEDARICDRLAKNAKSAQSGPTDDLTNVMLRHHMVASQNCAIDIRASIKEVK